MADSYTLQMRILTPLCVGTGEKISAFTDYFIHGDRAVYVDHDLVRQRLAERLPQDKALVRDYMSEIRGKMSPSATRSEARLRDFLEQRLQLALESFPEQYPFYGGADPDGKLEIYRTIRNVQDPYIPGSSLKGAIKTAILYRWLREDSLGSRELGALANDLKLKVGAPYIQDLLKRRRECFEPAQRLSKEQQYELRPLEQVERELGHQFENTFKILFGDIHEAGRNRERMAFAGLVVGDTQPLDAKNLSLRTVQRLHLRNGSFGIPQCRECVNPNQTTTFQLNLQRAWFEGGPCPELARPNALDWLIETCDRFSAAGLAHDLGALDNSRNPNPPDAQRQYHQFLADTPFGAYAGRLRVGAGKPYFHNAMGLALFERDKEAFAHFQEIFGLGKPGQQQFPLTRVLTDPDYLPLGWISLSII